MPQGNKPLKRIKAGAMSATIWENESTGPNGNFKFLSVSLDRSYQDKEGNWKQTNSMRLNDIPKALVALQEAYKELVLAKPKTENGTPQSQDSDVDYVE